MRTFFLSVPSILIAIGIFELLHLGVDSPGGTMLFVVVGAAIGTALQAVVVAVRRRTSK